MLSSLEKSEKLAIEAGWEIAKVAFTGVGITFKYGTKIAAFPTSVASAAQTLEACIDVRRSERKALKMQLIVTASFVKALDENVRAANPRQFISKMAELHAADSVSTAVKTAAASVWRNIERYEKRSSGWMLDDINGMEWTLWELDSLRARKVSERAKAKQRTTTCVRV